MQLKLWKPEVYSHFVLPPTIHTTLNRDISYCFQCKLWIFSSSLNLTGNANLIVSRDSTSGHLTKALWTMSDHTGQRGVNQNKVQWRSMHMAIYTPLRRCAISLGSAPHVAINHTILSGMKNSYLSSRCFIQKLMFQVHQPYFTISRKCLRCQR